jgi:hypothetical protein
MRENTHPCNSCCAVYEGKDRLLVFFLLSHLGCSRTLAEMLTPAPLNPVFYGRSASSLVSIVAGSWLQSTNTPTCAGVAHKRHSEHSSSYLLMEEQLIPFVQN